MSTFNSALLEMRDISLEFPGVKALENVDFISLAGNIHAVVGANGAGKSTLMKVLSGANNTFSGDIYINGDKKNINTPSDAKKLGIQVVYQEVDIALISNLTVAENIMLDDMVNNMEKRVFINWKEIHRKASEVLRKLNLDINTKKQIDELTLAEKQMVLIARSIHQKCQLLILDEPTAPLSNLETEELFRVVNDLKTAGVGVIFISHRLPELFQICDYVTVMRNGKIVSNRKISETTQNEIVEDMLGRKLEDIFPENRRKIGKTIFEAVSLTDKNKLKNITIQLNQGEIIGIAGLVGAGKTELCKALFGDAEVISGDVLLEGKKLDLKSPYYAVRNGLAFVPEERRKEGIFAEESITTNISSANIEKFSKFAGFLDFKGEINAAKKSIEVLGIKTTDEKCKVGLLSGGNQQKIVIGKWLDADAKIFIFDEPTKGVDIGAKRDIFTLIDKLASQGKGIIYASSELSEIMGITDRVYVLYDGKIAKEFETASTNEEEVLFYSTGGGNYGIKI